MPGVDIAPRLASQVNLWHLQVQAVFAWVKLAAGARQISGDIGAGGKCGAAQVDAKPLQRITLQAHLGATLAVECDEGQGFASDPLPVEVYLGAVTAGQHHVTLVELGNIDLQTRCCTGEEGRVELDMFGTVGAHGIGAAQQQARHQGVETHIYDSQRQVLSKSRHRASLPRAMGIQRRHVLKN